MFLVFSLEGKVNVLGRGGINFITVSNGFLLHTLCYIHVSLNRRHNEIHSIVSLQIT